MINMKRFLFWLARIFNVDLTVEKIIYKDRIVEVPVEVIKDVIVEKQISLDGVIDGDVTIKGDLIVNGVLTVHGEVSCFKMKEG